MTTKQYLDKLTKAALTMHALKHGPNGIVTCGIEPYVQLYTGFSKLCKAIPDVHVNCTKHNDNSKTYWVLHNGVKFLTFVGEDEQLD